MPTQQPYMAERWFQLLEKAVAEEPKNRAARPASSIASSPLAPSASAAPS